MTAPGQEPDEVMTAQPGGDDDPDERTPATPDDDEEAEQLRNLDKIGDNHMPEDMRQAERSRAEGEPGHNG